MPRYLINSNSCYARQVPVCQPPFNYILNSTKYLWPWSLKTFSNLFPGQFFSPIGKKLHICFLSGAACRRTMELLLLVFRIADIRLAALCRWKKPKIPISVWIQTFFHPDCHSQVPAYDSLNKLVFEFFRGFISTSIAFLPSCITNLVSP